MTKQQTQCILITAIILVALSLSGCGFLNPKVQVNGVVKDKAGVPIAGAIVTFGKDSVTTNAQGAFLFEGVRKGTYDIMVVLADETIYSNTIVVEGKPVTLAIDYVPAAVQGSVVFRSANPVAGMTVKLGKHETITDAQGEFSFPSITFGIYDLTVRDGDTVVYGPTSVAVDAETIALDPVVIKLLISSGKTYIYPDRPPFGSYPDTNYELTDGFTAPALYSDAGWVGIFTDKLFTVQFDFEESVTVTEARLHLLAKSGGTKWPGKLAMVASDDGVNWSAPVEVTITEEQPEVGTVKWFAVEASSLTGRYIKVVMDPLGVGRNMFVSEIEIYQ